MENKGMKKVTIENMATEKSDGDIGIIEKYLEPTSMEIALKGLNFTMDDLAKRLGMSKKTIYKEVGSKENIIRALLISMKKDLNEQQVAIMEDEQLPLVDKMRALLTAVPAKQHLVTPITLHQLERQFPSLYSMLGDMYHQDWTRFDVVYEEALKKGLVRKMDLKFFKEMYIATVTHIPEQEPFFQMSHQEVLKKTVAILFDGLVIDRCEEVE